MTRRLWGLFASTLAAMLLLVGSATAAPLGYQSAVTEVQHWSFAAEPGNASWVRSFLWWKDIQRSDGTYNWGPYDQAYNEALRVGLTPQFALCGCQNPPNTNAQWSLWNQFVRRAVARYPAAMFEAWNEPNLGSSFWGGGAPNPAEYLQLLKSVSKVAGPGRTLPAGLAPVHDEDATTLRMPPVEFLRQVGVSKVKQLTARIDIHLYPRNQGRDLPPSEWVDSTISLVAPLRQLVGPNEQIQVGEIGFNSSYLPSEPSEFSYGDLTRETFTRLEQMPRVGPIFWFRLYSTGPTASYAVLQEDGTPLPPFWELAALAG
jgi:hypothetical protein